MAFPVTAPMASAVFFRTYSRFTGRGRESWDNVCDRTISALVDLGRLTPEEAALINQQQRNLTSLPSGRWLWCGGTEWLKSPENFIGAYNCSSLGVSDWHSFGLLMDMAMQGTGTGAVLEGKYLNKLPPIVRPMEIVTTDIGTVEPASRLTKTKVLSLSTGLKIVVGDSRQGWAESYQHLLELASHKSGGDSMIYITVDLSNVRPQGERLNGFGGISNPSKLPELYHRVAAILNGAVGRQLSSVECCQVIDEAAWVVVAGNVRRSAGMRQFNATDQDAYVAKDNLWVMDGEGKWSIDPARQALTMANHTRVFHTKPTLDDCKESVRKQYHSGEGAIQWAGEAIARANVDLLDDPQKKQIFLHLYQRSTIAASKYLNELGKEEISNKELEHRISRYALNPCGEIIGSDFLCNLSEVHLNQIDPKDTIGQYNAFRAGALSVLSLLHHEFVQPRHHYSRRIDPIIGVSVTGLFDFFVAAFGVNWLRWWEAGRPVSWVPDNRLEEGWGWSEPDLGAAYLESERDYLQMWRKIVGNTVDEYCTRHNIKKPNRYTTVQPAGTKSLLTGASPGFHPPKAQRFIRRVTFAKDDPVALACIQQGYKAIPSASSKDAQGNLLDDIHDPRTTEWLIEFPVEVPWANLPGADAIDVSKFSALAQLDFMMQVQKYYVGHNCSATIEIRENEIDDVAERIYQAIANDEGYISATLLARFDDLQTFPRLPFEPINQKQYELEKLGVYIRKITEDPFEKILGRYDNKESTATSIGPAGCDSAKCLIG